MSKEQTGMCDSLEEFLELWRQYPKAPLHLHIRNYSTIKGDQYTGPKRSSMAISLVIPELRAGGRGAIYLENPELQKILPSSIFQELAKLETRPDGRGVCFADIVSLGPLIAGETGREVTFTRQFGSGNPDEADYEDFGPFFPEEKFTKLNQETRDEQLSASVHMGYLGFVSEEDLKEMLAEYFAEQNKILRDTDSNT